MVFLLKEISTTLAEKDENNLKFIKLLASSYIKNTKTIILFVCNINLNFLDKIYVTNTIKVI